MNGLPIAFGIGLLISAIAAAPIMALLLRLRSRQIVSQFVAEHAHKQGTPTMGGLIIITGLVGALLVGATWLGTVAIQLVIFVIGFAAIGFFDDFVVPRMYPGKRGLGWIQKLGLQFFVAAVTLMPFQLKFDPIQLAITVLVVLFYANAYNFADGLDWLAGSILFAYGIGLFGIVGTLGATPIQWVILATLGAAVPFMVLNRPKARVFMGDVGSMPIGGLLGLLTLTAVWPSVALSLSAVNPTYISSKHIYVELIGPALILSLMMVAELVPVPIQILSVKLRKKRVFPATPIHHAFQRAGMKETRVVFWFFFAQVIFSLLAYGLVVLQPPEVPEQPDRITWTERVR